MSPPTPKNNLPDWWWMDPVTQEYGGVRSERTLGYTHRNTDSSWPGHSRRKGFRQHLPPKVRKSTFGCDRFEHWYVVLNRIFTSLYIFIPKRRKSLILRYLTVTLVQKDLESLSSSLLDSPDRLQYHLYVCRNNGIGGRMGVSSVIIS